MIALDKMGDFEASVAFGASIKEPISSEVQRLASTLTWSQMVASSYPPVSSCPKQLEIIVPYIGSRNLTSYQCLVTPLKNHQADEGILVGYVVFDFDEFREDKGVDVAAPGFPAVHA